MVLSTAFHLPAVFNQWVGWIQTDTPNTTLPQALSSQLRMLEALFPVEPRSNVVKDPGSRAWSQILPMPSDGYPPASPNSPAPLSESLPVLRWTWCLPPSSRSWWGHRKLSHSWRQSCPLHWGPFPKNFLRQFWLLAIFLLGTTLEPSPLCIKSIWSGAPA